MGVERPVRIPREQRYRFDHPEMRAPIRVIPLRHRQRPAQRLDGGDAIQNFLLQRLALLRCIERIRKQHCPGGMVHR